MIVVGYDVPWGWTRFDSTIDVVEGDELRVVDAAGDPLNASFRATVCTDGPENGTVALEGLVVLGTRSAPELLSIPVHWRRERENPLFLPIVRHDR